MLSFRLHSNDLWIDISNMQTLTCGVYTMRYTGVHIWCGGMRSSDHFCLIFLIIVLLEFQRSANAYGENPISSGIISSYTFLFSQTPICTIPTDWSDFDPDVRVWSNASISWYFCFIITYDNYYNNKSALCDYTYKL